MRLLVFLISGSLLTSQAQAAYLLVPPDAEEIKSVLGADAHGLRLRADALPDLFALTASRLEEDPKIFIVEEPYLSGHWQGGKAVIEFARDLSYTQVSIFDKYGRRQRIYAVRSKLEEDKDEKRHQAALALQARNAFSGVPSDVDEDEDRPRRRHPAPPPPSPEAVAEFEETASEPEVKTPRPPVETPSAAVPVVKTANASAPVPPITALEPDDTAGAGGPHFEWDEARGAYVKVDVKVVAAATPTAAPKVAVMPAAPTPSVDLHPSPEGTGDWAALNAELEKRNKAVDIPPYRQPPPKTDGEAPAATPQSAPVVAVATPVPAKKSKSKRKANEVQAPPEQVIVPSSDAYDLPADEKKGAVTTPVAVTDPALAAATASLAQKQAAAAAAQIPGITDTVSTGKSKLDSDDWVPSNAKPAQEPGMTVQEKSRKPAPDSSIDGLMKLASINEGAVPNEANQWVPKATSLPTPDADIHEELSRVQSGKQKNVPVPAVKINRDINNPEEGVLPVNSFEKFSGSRYGRHREYERRIFFAKKANAPIPPKSYDFYVDETDRKKEIHNVYYYAHESKSKPPRLIAVEKHTRVTFLSNYDVDKEDKGKVSRY